jgi:hypothetical protein
MGGGHEEKNASRADLSAVLHCFAAERPFAEEILE